MRAWAQPDQINVSDELVAARQEATRNQII